MKQMRNGKSSELVVAGLLIGMDVDVYMPAVDDQGIDFLTRTEGKNGATTYHEIQVKSVRGYNRIIGVRPPSEKNSNYILVIRYCHESKPDEFFYLTANQVHRHLKKGTQWGDLIFNKAERQEYAGQDLKKLAAVIRGG